MVIMFVLVREVLAYWQKVTAEESWVPSQCGWGFCENGSSLDVIEGVTFSG